MNCEEIFTKLIQHQVTGLMIHEQFTNYYDFLGLEGYKECQEHHYWEESCSFRQSMHYYISHYDKLISEFPAATTKIIPDSWYRYSREDVDMSTKMNAVKSAVLKWQDWETETKELYEQCYKDLMELGDVAGALYVEDLVEDVTCELKRVKSYVLNLKAVDYNLDYIVAEQARLKDKYKKEMKSYD